MSTFLHHFEAIESRIAFGPCPRGTNGRLHVLRLRRFFQNGLPSQQRPQTDLGGFIAREQSATDDVTYDKDQSNPERERLLESSPGEPAQETSSNAHNTKSYLVRDFARELGHARVHRRAGWRFFREIEPIRRVWLVETPSKLPASGHGDALRGPGFSTHKEFTENANASRLYEALRMRNPHAVLGALMQLVYYDGYRNFDSAALAFIPPPAFSEILRCLDPKHFVGDRYSKLFAEASPRYHNALGLPPVRNYRFRAVFLSQLRGIISARNKTFAISLSDYKYLLACARATADPGLATIIWDIMKERQVRPDLECYNHYLASKCWSDDMYHFTQNRLRVIPWNTGPRTWQQKPYRLSGHRVGREGLKLQATTIFSDMARAGIGGNEETFCLIMTALAREGDTNWIASILKRVWGIDVEALMKTDGRRPQPLKSYSPDSPLYPSHRLLFTLAHVYGINNSIPTSLSIIDYVSQQYSLTIPLTVWKELLRWTYVLSADMKSREKLPPEEGHLTGQLPSQAVSSLWTTMTSEPYNVEPTMAMYDWIIPNLIQRQNFTTARLLMDEARELHKKAVEEHHHCKLLLADHVTRGGNLQERARISRDLQYTKLRWRRSVLYLRKWVNKLVQTMSHSLRRNPIWYTMDVQDVLREWHPFLLVTINYLAEGGRVAIRSQSKHINRIRHWRFKRTARPMSTRMRGILTQKAAERAVRQLDSGATSNW